MVHTSHRDTDLLTFSKIYSKIKNKLFEYVSKNITLLTVIGGEPTVIPEFWEMFEYLENKDSLKKLNNFDVTLKDGVISVKKKL